MFDLAGIGSLITGIGTLGMTVVVWRNVKTSNGHTLGELGELVHAEVTTGNGIPLGELADRQEGRRVNTIPEEDRTESEQGYSDRLKEGGRDR